MMEYNHIGSNSTWRSYVLGASAPDAFKKLSPTMHSLKFALVQYKLALKQPKTADFDPVAYSLGYGSHLAEDYVGHYKNGYITPEYDHYIECKQLLYSLILQSLPTPTSFSATCMVIFGSSHLFTLMTTRNNSLSQPTNNLLSLILPTKHSPKMISTKQRKILTGYLLRSPHSYQ
jgi:hypothetical protein